MACSSWVWGDESTYQIDEDLLAGLQGDFLAVVVDDGWLYDFAW